MTLPAFPSCLSLSTGVRLYISRVRDLPSRVAVVYLICPPFCYPRSHSAEWRGPKEGGSPGFFATVRFAVRPRPRPTKSKQQLPSTKQLRSRSLLPRLPLLTMVRSVAGRESVANVSWRGQTTHGPNQLPNALPARVAFRHCVTRENAMECH